MIVTKFINMYTGECKVFMLKYMICLRENGNNNTNCRSQSKDYLDCRMEAGLMIKEDWKKLGYGDLIGEKKA